MALTGPAHRTPAHPRRRTAAHKLEYLVTIILNAVLFFLLNVGPGWQVLPFLTPETTQVLDLFNFSLMAAIIINAIYMLYDAPWCKALGSLLLAAIGLAVLQRIWAVFPFTFTSGWPVPLAHAVLVVAIVATVVAMITDLVLLVRHSIGTGDER
jgi:hypothetical protein